MIIKKMVAFTAPSGAGKSTVVGHLLDTFDQLAFSVSATTRPPRPHEKHGRHYYFLSPDEFEERIRKDAFVEYEEVYQNLYYGTLKSEVERLWKEGKFVIFDIDVIGAQNLKKTYGDNCLAVFVKPPSFEVLVQRLKSRNTENARSLEKRIERIKRELDFEEAFDKILINDHLPSALLEAEDLVRKYLNI